MNILSELGYIEYHRGHFDAFTASGHRSRIRVNTKLIKHFESSAITTAMIMMDKDEETIILRKAKDKSSKSKKKELVDYIDTNETNKMRNNLEGINVLLDRTWIDI